MLRLVLSLAILALVVGDAVPAEPTAPSVKQLQTAVEKALPLLMKGAEGHVAERTCFACHNQAVPILAFTTAQERGLRIPAWDLKKQFEFITAFLAGHRENYRQGRGQGGQVDTAGYALFTLELGGQQSDATTEAVVEYLLLHNRGFGRWRTTSNRPPSEACDFTPTFLAIRALRRWGTSAQQDRITERVDAARRWLIDTPAKDTEERVFRLWALQTAGAAKEEIQSALRELVHYQRPDGGWGQTEALDSDAYATGSALVALHQAGGLAADDPAYRRGLAFLLKTQQDDGSWLVHTRSKPIQIYYESGFPHGKDQFISMAASGWAATALALACPVPAQQRPQREPRPGGRR
jgi:hypothetical protein